MTLNIAVIQHLFPEKRIHHRLNDLYRNHPDIEQKDNYIYLSIEINEQCRQFFYSSIDDLSILFQRSTNLHKPLYEIIKSTRQIKPYIDFEYNIETNPEIIDYSIGLRCVLKILHNLCHKHSINSIPYDHLTNNLYERYTILEAYFYICMFISKSISLSFSSTSNKKSFHIIDSESNLLIENNQSFRLLLHATLHYLLTCVLAHKCSSFGIKFDVKRHSLQQIISVTSSHLLQLRTTCTNCMLWRDTLSAAEITNLLVRDKNSKWTLAIDLSVYSRNQQFRCFDCVKIGKCNPLIRFQSITNMSNAKKSYTDNLLSSLITYNPMANACNVLQIENSEIVIRRREMNSTFIPMNNYSYYHEDISQFILGYATPSPRSTFEYTMKTTSHNTFNISSHNYETLPPDITTYHTFVNHIITTDPNHRGFIRSYVTGTKYDRMIFFNIGGNYRYCTKKGTHHLRNTTAFIVNTEQRTFAIRCKDPECDNSILTWNKIN